MQKQDLGQLNIMPRHTFLRTALTRERSNSPARETAFEHMLQGAVKEVSVHSMCMSLLLVCEGLAVILRAQWPLCTNPSSHSKAQHRPCLSPRVCPSHGLRPVQAHLMLPAFS